ncbi:MAG TPA: hypothetical protein VGH87_19630 [Polyangiaceae bacterium]|nr:hypothetical protein [Polyangiaceae bacterium]
MRRPSHAGDKVRVVVDSTVDESSKTYTEQVVVKKAEKHHRLHLDAIEDIRAVDAFGDAQRVELTITSFTNRDVVVLAPGQHLTIVLAPKKADAVVDVDGAHASADVRELVEAVLPLAHTPADADAVVGTRVRQRVGGSWRVDDAAMIGELARTGAAVKPEALVARASLADIERSEGVECMDVRIDLDVSAFEPVAPLPEGSQVTRSKVAVHIDEHLPLAVDRPRLRSEVVVHSEFEAFVAVNGQAEVAGVTIDRTNDETRKVRYTPVR